MSKNLSRVFKPDILRFPGFIWGEGKEKKDKGSLYALTTVQHKVVLLISLGQGHDGD